MDIYLIRHTTPAIEKGICYGQADVDVEKSFRDEAHIVQAKLPMDVARIYSSISSRCTKLATVLFPGREIDFRDSLQEINCGDWELRRWSDINPVELDHWMKNYEHVRYPGGENLLEFRARVLESWQTITRVNTSPAVIVTHAGVMRIILAETRGVKIMDVDKYFDLSFGTVVHVNV
jgi:alpha-ribazole phosphatase